MIAIKAAKMPCDDPAVNIISSEYSLAAAGGDDDVVGRKADMVFFVVASEFLAIAEQALAGTIFEHGALETMQGMERIRGRGDVGLTDVEMIYFYAPSLCLYSQGSKFANGRGGHLERAF